MGLRRVDLGLFVSALAAAGLIVVFLGLTDGNSAEESTSTTTPPPAAPALRPGRLVRYPSPQVPDVAWSSARGAFSIQCRGGRLIRLDARITSLPADHRYAWRGITGDANETVPLSRVPGLRAELVEGDGLPSSFTPAAGAATVRFNFDGRSPPESLGLNVLGVHRFSSFVIASPQMTCRR